MLDEFRLSPPLKHNLCVCNGCGCRTHVSTHMHAHTGSGCPVLILNILHVGSYFDIGQTHSFTVSGSLKNSLPSIHLPELLSAVYPCSLRSPATWSVPQQPSSCSGRNWSLQAPLIA